jgi:hypothetical protein
MAQSECSKCHKNSQRNFVSSEFLSTGSALLFTLLIQFHVNLFRFECHPVKDQENVTMG